MTGINNYFEYSEIVLGSRETTQNNGSVDWPIFNFNLWKPNLAGIKVLSAELPDVFDIVSSGNNTLIYTAAGVPNVITVSTGAPSGATLASQLQAQISAINPGFTVTYNASNFQFTFTQSAALTWSLTFQTKYSLYRAIGFDLGVYTASGGGSTLASTNFAQLNGPTYISVNSKTLGPYVHCDGPDGTSSYNIGRIGHTNNSRGNNILFTDPTPDLFFDYIGTDISKFDIYFTLGPDEIEQPLSFKGLGWSLKLGLLSYRDGAIENKQVPRIGKTIFK